MKYVPNQDGGLCGCDRERSKYLQFCPCGCLAKIVSLFSKLEYCRYCCFFLQNYPLYLRTVSPEEELKFHYTVHTSLDVVEEKGRYYLALIEALF